MRNVFGRAVVGISLVATASFASVNVASVERFGRPVMADGLLMEWKSETAQMQSGPFSFRWDAVNTPQGLSGYLLFADTAHLPCEIIIQPVGSVPFRTDLKVTTAGIFGVQRDIGGIIVEWSIPKEALAPDAAGRYSVACALVALGDTTGPVSILYTGSLTRPSRSVLSSFVTPGLIVQVGLILLLGVLYVLLASRIRRKKRERVKKPHEIVSSD